MDRRGFLGSLVAALVAPFLPKVKTAKPGPVPLTGQMWRSSYQKIEIGPHIRYNVPEGYFRNVDLAGVWKFDAPRWTFARRDPARLPL